MTAFKEPGRQRGLIVTLNRMGYMLSIPDEFNQAFIDFASHAEGPVLDIGAAYGLATLKALENGAYVVSNDLDERHLEILKSKTPPQFLDRLELKPGRIPHGVDFPQNSFSAVLASRVLNFLLPEEMEIAVREIFRWLKPGGRFFILGGTPDMQTFRRFYPLYAERKAKGLPYPGFIDHIPRYVLEPEVDELPESILLFDEDLIRNSLENAGFRIDKIGYSSVISLDPDNLGGNIPDTIGAVAIKPL